ncbi:MAG: exosortase-dependent surface protein XDP2 [Rivularia sp. (in: cyanobacteria)]
MKFIKLATSIGLTVGSVLFAANSAQAASFKSNVTQNNGAKGDVFLNSIEQNGKTIFESDFSYVYRADIKSNDEYTGKNTGGASTDKGDNVDKDGIKRREKLQDNDGDEQNVVDFLGNNNLNKIIDTEDTGNFAMDLFFDSDIRANDQGLDSLFFWERNMNSDLEIFALNNDGNILGDVFKLERKVSKKNPAGFSIDTLEIGSAQAVGSWGVSFADLGLGDNEILSGIKVISKEGFNGPDFKVIARKSSGPDFVQAAKVPEPGSIIGLSSVAALAFIRRRKSK